MKVLYPTDGLVPADEAGRLLQRIGDRERLEVTVLSVTHAGIPAPEHALFQIDPLPGRRSDSVAIVDAAVETLRAEGFHASGRVSEGHPGQEILRAVEDDWYDLTVLGAGGRSWLSDRLLGSVSAYVLHNSPSSVLIVHDILDSSPGSRILVGTDGSRGSDKAVQWISAFADPKHCEMVTLCVVPEPILFPRAVPGTLDPEEGQREPAEVEGRALRRAQQLSESAATRLTDAGFKVEAKAASGVPIEQLLKEFGNGAYDLIAVGSRGLGPFRRSLLGSVSEQIVRHVGAAFVARRSVQ